jgi:hypothetical protein
MLLLRVSQQRHEQETVFNSGIDCSWKQLFVIDVPLEICVEAEKEK